MTAYVPRVYDASASYDQFVHRARARRAPAPRANRFPGPCALCGGRVEAEAGHLAGSKPQHTPGTCPADPAPAYRENRFAGPCASCGGWVDARAGRVDRTSAGWKTSHVGTCPAPAEPAGTPAVAAGYYATVSRTGRNDFDFWQVEHGTGTWAGRVFVRRVIGGQSPQRIRRDEQATALDAIAAEGEQVTRERYADVTRNCWACDIHLTDGLSRLVKTGPDCCRNRFGMTQRAYARELGHAAEVIAAAVAGGDDDAEVIEQAEAALANAELAG